MFETTNKQVSPTISPPLIVYSSKITLIQSHPKKNQKITLMDGNENKRTVYKNSIPSIPL